MEQSLLSITIQQIVIFLTVAETKGFSKAGEKLHLTQPAISKSIAKLEAELGITLFQRTTRELYLTEEGKIYYKGWKAASGKILSTYEQVMEYKRKEDRTIHVAVTGSTNPRSYFWPLVDNFIRDNEDVEFNVDSDNMEKLCDKIIEGSYDMVFVPDFQHYVLDDNQIPWKWAAKDHVQLVIPKINPLFNRSMLTLDDIIDEKFVVIDEQMNENYVRNFAEFFDKCDVRPKISKSYKNVYAIRNAYRPTEGIILIDNYFNFEFNDDIKKIPLQGYYNGIICAWKPNVKSESVQRFIDSVRA